MDYDLHSLLPSWYREVLDYQQICQTEEQQFEALAGEITAVAQNFFFQTMDVGAVQQWEQILGIAANPATETLAFRQDRLINRISTKPPFTLQFLYQKLDELIGPGQWNVRMDYPNYTLYIESYAQDQSYATELAITIGRIKPAHIVYINSSLINSAMTMTEQISNASRTWNYIMSAWNLGDQPFATDTKIGVIKMTSTPSIQPKLLNDVANFTASDVAAARINGAFMVSPLGKEVNGNILTISYTIKPDQVNTVTRVELVDAYGNALTDSTCYVPVTTTQVLTHTIPVQEANNG
ncbi:putative phage tail protein [uncultured Flavonifractor sp.]|uniref:putative phage tail protein n=1 Tax=uncultured Flavonifractor sp. TaxID=1193534 RepID=UPI00261452E1|nr:putative phage tail protein [uncultured Flavonifractor sp.]